MMQTVSANRFFYLDAARSIMLLLGIPFHISEIYRLSDGYSIDSPDPSIIASAVSAVVHVFRMPAFFILSGFFAAMLLQRGTPETWLRSRTWKLGLPLVATALLLGPVEKAIVAYYNETSSWGEAFQSAYAMPVNDWVNHRWFLIVLIMYCATFACAHPFIRQIRFPLRVTGFNVLSAASFGLILVATPFMAIIAGKLAGEAFISADFLKQYANLYVKYLPFFGFGYLVYVLHGSLERITRIAPWEVPIAALSIGCYFFTYFAFYPDGGVGSGTVGQLTEIGRIACECVAGFYAARIFYLWMISILNRESLVVRYFVDASFCIYLVHEVFLLIAGGWFLDVAVEPLVEMLLIGIFTLLGSVAVFEVVKRSPFLIEIFNGGPIAKRASVRTLTSGVS